MPITTRNSSRTRQDWLDLAEPILKDLPGSPTDEWAFGEKVDALYAAADHRGPLTNGRDRPPWKIVQRLDHPVPAKANELALSDLLGGADELALVLRGAQSAAGFGLTDSENSLRRSLDGIEIEAISLRLEPHPAGLTHSIWLADLIAKRDISPRQCKISFGLDPVGCLARQGETGELGLATDSGGVGAAKSLSDQGFSGPFFECDTRVFSEAGADPAQQLAAALATAANYLREIDAAGLKLSHAHDWIGTTLTASANQSITIAKLRAWRLVWQRLLSECGLEARPNRLHAETGRLMMMRQDPETNLLRTTIAAFSAGVAGADSLSVLPYSTAVGLPGRLARRLARNTQLLLLREAHVGKVQDSAAGSGAYETLTDKLAHRAWTMFQDLESEGGIVESLRSNRLQPRIAAAKARLRSAIRDGSAPLVGATNFQNNTAGIADILDVEPLHDASAAERGTGRPILPFDIELDHQSQSDQVDHSGARQ